MGCTRVSSSRSSAQTLTCGAAYLETSYCQVSRVLLRCCVTVQQFKDALHLWQAVTLHFDCVPVNPLILAESFSLISPYLKVGTHCCLDCLSVSKLKSKACYRPTCGRALASPAPRTETPQCGAEEPCWPTCPVSARRGSVKRNTKSVVHRSSSESAFKMERCEAT